jgi:hypothetical protein
MKIRMFYLVLAIFFLSRAPAFAMQYAVSHKNGVQVITLGGEIEEKEADVFAKFIGQVRTDEDTILYFKEHPGGYSDASFRIAAALVKLRREITESGHIAYAYVKDSCASACLTLFVSFQWRGADSQSTFGIHSPFINDRPDPNTRDSYLDDLQNFGVKGSWIQKHLPDFMRLEVTDISARQALQEQSGLIQEVLSPSALLKKIALAGQRRRSSP